MIERAFKQRWPVTPDVKAKAASRALLAADQQNNQTDDQTPSATDGTNRFADIARSIGIVSNEEN